MVSTVPPPGEYPDEATLAVLRHDTAPPEEERTGVVDMSEVIRQHEETHGAALYWHNLQALHDLAAMRTL